MNRNITARLEKAQDLYRQADREGRKLTTQETKQVEAALDVHRAEKSSRSYDRLIGGPGDVGGVRGCHFGTAALHGKEYPVSRPRFGPWTFR